MSRLIAMNEVLYKDTGGSVFLVLVGRSPKARELDLFLAAPYFDFSREEVARELGMSKHTVYRVVRELEELGVLRVSRKVGRAVMYRLNRESPVVKKLEELVYELSRQIAEEELKRTKLSPVEVASEK